MRSPILAVSIATSCLVAVLIFSSIWGVQHGLLRAPTGIARVGNLEVMAFTGLQFSTVRPTRAYYTVWVALRDDVSEVPRQRRPLLWARRLFQLEVPVPTTDT
jgi:hypothetical protein